MEWLDQIPAGVWELPLPILMLVLLASGVLVTRREHNNMITMMEYFRGLCTTKDETIATQARTISAYKEAAITTKKMAQSIQEVTIEAKGESYVSKETS